MEMGECRMKYAKIAILRKNNISDQLFTYEIPQRYEKGIRRGMFAVVSFGKNPFQIGLICELSSELEEHFEKIKPVLSILGEDMVLPSSLISLGFFMQRQYLCSVGEAFQVLLSSSKYTKIDYLKIYFGEESFGEEIPSFLKECQKRGLDLIEFQKRMKHQNIPETYWQKWFISGKLKISLSYTSLGSYSIYKVPGVNYEKEMEMLNSRAVRQKKVLSFFVQEEEIEEKELYMKLGIDKKVLEPLLKKRLVERREKKEETKKISRVPVTLHKRQKDIVEDILSRVQMGQSKFFLHGITGSGKTEVYLRILQEMKFEEQAIILVPEISLTPQTIKRFQDVFGEQIAVIHSKLNDTERNEAWNQAATGEKKIIIGARSAIFTPCKCLKWILLDEVHDTSYISQQSPKYNTVEIAKKRAELEGASVLMGTATPGVEQYLRCQDGTYQYYFLGERAIGKNLLPQIKIVDMRNELLQNNMSFFSKEMYHALKETLERKEQAIFFLNRRGYVPLLTCKSCGYVEMCPNCDKPLTFHHESTELQCHYCGYRKSTKPQCPSCGSGHYKLLGIGTQRVEALLKKIVKNGTVLRIDADTVSRKGSLEQCLKEFSDGKYQMLVGTQMIAKGIDFKNVTLVGVLSADMGTQIPHYLATEKAFQMLMQVSGRSGRHKEGGKVIFQTYQPENIAIQAAARQDFQSFYKTEIQLRKEFDYPPFVYLIQILFQHEVRENAFEAANQYEEWIRAWGKDYFLEKDIIYPAGPTIAEKMNKLYRVQSICKFTEETFEKAKDFIYNKTREMRKLDKKLTISININENFIC